MQLRRNLHSSMIEGRFPEFVREFLQQMFLKGEIPEWICDAMDVAGINSSFLPNTPSQDKREMKFFLFFGFDSGECEMSEESRMVRKRQEKDNSIGLVDVYRKTLKSDGIAGLYCGFNISCVGIIVYRGLYFGLYESLKPVVLTGGLQGSFFDGFALGWLITNGAGANMCPLVTSTMVDDRVKELGNGYAWLGNRCAAAAQGGAMAVQGGRRLCSSGGAWLCSAVRRCAAAALQWLASVTAVQRL